MIGLLEAASILLEVFEFAESRSRTLPAYVLLRVFALVKAGLEFCVHLRSSMPALKLYLAERICDKSYKQV